MVLGLRDDPLVIAVGSPRHVKGCRLVGVIMKHMCFWYCVILHAGLSWAPQFHNHLCHSCTYLQKGWGVIGIVANAPDFASPSLNVHDYPFETTKHHLLLRCQLQVRQAVDSPQKAISRDCSCLKKELGSVLNTYAGMGSTFEALIRPHLMLVGSGCIHPSVVGSFAWFLYISSPL